MTTEIKQTYAFRDLLKWIREKKKGPRDSYISNIQKDIDNEFEGAPNRPQIFSSNMDFTGHNLHLTFTLQPEDSRLLSSLLHNVHCGKRYIK